jgi:N utilization substance protein B
MKAQRRARSVALQVLYEIDCTNHPPGEVITLRLHHERGVGRPLGKTTEELVHHLVSGVLANRDALDTLIHDHAPEWPLDQMAIIDRNVLRIAIFELVVSSNTPTKIAINEAVELAKLYGSDSTPRFVNGVLGTLAAKQAELIAAFNSKYKNNEG